MKTKIILLTLLSALFLIQTALAENVTVVTAPYTDAAQTTKNWDNLINAEIHVDPENTITEIQVRSLSVDTGATIQLTFENKTIVYTGQETNQDWSILGIHIMNVHYISHMLLAGNTTVFNETISLPQPDGLYMEVATATNSINNSFHIYSTFLDIDSHVQTQAIPALPAQSIRIQSDSPYNVFIIYGNSAEAKAKIDKVQQLNWLLHIIFNFANGLGTEAGDAVLPLLTIINIVFIMVTIMLDALYTYPYLVIIWYITLLNVYVSFKTETFSDFIVKWVQGAWVGIEWGVFMVIKLVWAVVGFLKLLRQIFQI